MLLRYNDLTKDRAAKPTPVVVVKTDAVEKEVVMEAPPATSTQPANIVGTLPKMLQEKAPQLLSRLSKVAWNERRELMHEGVAITGSKSGFTRSIRFLNLQWELIVRTKADERAFEHATARRLLRKIIDELPTTNGAKDAVQCQ